MDRFVRVHFYVLVWVMLLLLPAAAPQNISTEAERCVGRLLLLFLAASISVL